MPNRDSVGMYSRCLLAAIAVLMTVANCATNKELRGKRSPQDPGPRRQANSYGNSNRPHGPFAQMRGPPPNRGPPENRGPPPNRGPPQNRSPPPNRGPPGNRGPPPNRGPPGNRGPPSDRGPPDNRGPPNARDPPGRDPGDRPPPVFGNDEPLGVMQLLTQPGPFGRGPDGIAANQDNLQGSHAGIITPPQIVAMPNYQIIDSVALANLLSAKINSTTSNEQGQGRPIVSSGGVESSTSKQTTAHFIQALAVTPEE